VTRARLQRIDAPSRAAIARKDELADLACVEDSVWLFGVDRQPEDWRLQPDARLGLLPGRSVVPRDEQDAAVTVEVIGGAEIERFPVVGRVAESTAVGADRAQERCLQVSPMRTAVVASEHAEAGRDRQLARDFRIDHDGVNVDEAFVEIEPVDHVLPARAAVETAQEPADF
jgi:hypothetical protein